jgi:phytanoyl-CoA hydroxylase
VEAMSLDPRTLTPEQVRSFHERGFLRVESVFSPAETDALAVDLDELLASWGYSARWTGDWRQALLDPAVEERSEIHTLHDLQLYSAVWSRAVGHPGLVGVVADLLGSAVEFHHTTTHVKPPEIGMPFPMHQDHPFYPHESGQYVDVLFHLDDTTSENGEIRFLEGSHKAGPLEHITENAAGPCTPFLPLDRYRLEDTVPVPAKRGDIVCFSIFTVHGSHLNTSDRPRRLVRAGYRDPANRQLSGQSAARPGLMVRGLRPRAAGQAPFPTVDA